MISEEDKYYDPEVDGGGMESDAGEVGGEEEQGIGGLGRWILTHPMWLALVVDGSVSDEKMFYRLVAAGGMYGVIAWKRHSCDEIESMGVGDMVRHVAGDVAIVAALAPEGREVVGQVLRTVAGGVVGWIDQIVASGATGKLVEAVSGSRPEPWAGALVGFMLGEYLLRHWEDWWMIRGRQAASWGERAAEWAARGLLFWGAHRAFELWNKLKPEEAIENEVRGTVGTDR